MPTEKTISARLAATHRFQALIRLSTCQFWARQSQGWLRAAAEGRRGAVSPTEAECLRAMVRAS